MKKKNGKKYSDINVVMAIIGVILGLFCLLLIGIMFFAIASSFNDVMNFNRNPLNMFSTFKTENYSNVFLYMQIRKTIGGRQFYIKAPEMYLNSVLFSVGAAFSAVIVMCTTAYMCAKYRNWFSKLISGIVIVTMIVPIIGNTPSALDISIKLGLYNKIYGMCIMKASFLGMYFLIFIAAFNGIPDDFGEAAQIDGASQFYTYVLIYLPLVRNMFFTMIILNFIGNWNDYQGPMLFMPDKPTISFGLFYLTQYPDNRFNGNTPLFLAASILVAFPTILLFCAFHDRLLGNLSMGGIKG
ncbi:MAG: carbohydrate ABC transporter permease [Clostridia bacterium]|nr:carbohydrate ABC transporter permease [Clostridia bacterium]